MEFTEYELSDIDFLIERFGALTERQVYELPSEFAERVRYLPADLTPFPGRFNWERFPYFKKIVDCMAPDNPIREVVLMKGNQLGGTTAIIETIILYNIMSNPTAQAYITADAGLMKTSMQTKIEKMIDNAGARDLIFSQNRKQKGSRDTGDTAFSKEYPGGYLHCFGSRAPARFRSMSYRNILADEVDAFPDAIKKEGSVIDLVRNRTDAYSTKRKIFWASTPLVKQTSKIERLYEAGNQQKYFVPCKHCGKMQELVWHGKNEDGTEFGIVWENDKNFMPIIETVAYKCKFCGGLMKNYDKASIVKKGEWRPTAEALNPFTVSFHLSPIYNPSGMYSWEDMVLQWAECWDIKNNRVRDKEKYRIFRNTKQGLTFEEMGKQIRYERAVQFRRAGFVRGKVPNDLAVRDSGSPVLIVCCSVDVQKKNLFVDVKGYSDKGVTWTLDFFSIDGDTEDFNGPWDKLYKYIEETRFVGDDGKVYKIMITLVDSGRYTEYVYAFAGRYYAGVYPCKGAEYIKAGETYRIFDRSTLQRIGLPLAYHVNTTKMKDRISNSMSVLMWNEGQFQPDWYPNFPDDFRDDYFKMFEAETKVDIIDKLTNRYQKTIWKQRPGADNHAFDTYGYNMAGLEIFADAYCREFLGLPGLSWAHFWEEAKRGVFIEP